MNILVTGGAGYIGSHAVRELTANGHSVIVYDNLSKGHVKSIGNTPLVIGDLHNKSFLVDVMKEHQIEAVMHFAADSLVGESMQNPQKYYINNVAGSLSLFQAMLEADVKHIVFSSTAALFGEPDTVPITEHTAIHPTNVYGMTKMMIEQILHDYDMAYGLKYVALRYFNAAGAHPDGDIGEDHTPETHLIPIVLQVASGVREKMYVFGNDYHIGDGTCIRDYIHVCDLANAHLLAIEAVCSDHVSRTYNLGNGKGYSVLEIIQTAEKVTGKKIPWEVAPRRKGDPNILIASSELIQRELGWQRRFASLEDILSTAWEWHKNHPHGFDDKAEERK